MQEIKIPIRVEERDGLQRENEPVRIGIPLPKGISQDISDFEMFDENNLPIPLQCKRLASWPDRTIKWMLIDFLASLPESCRSTFWVKKKINDNSGMLELPKRISIHKNDSSFSVDTGSTLFRVGLDSHDGGILSVITDEKDQISAKSLQLKVIDENGNLRFPEFEDVSIEDDGPLRATIILSGKLKMSKGNWLRFEARLTFFAGSSLVQIDLGIHNPQAALHPGGLWDLGDPGAIFFKEISLALNVNEPIQNIEYCVNPKKSFQKSHEANWTIYQDSSGGENWDSLNHIDFQRNSTVSFSGYRVFSDNIEAPFKQGTRATPSIKMNFSKGWIAGTIQGFWQNFPKALSIKNGTLSLGLFPSESKSLFEIQGGEKKRHTIFLESGMSGEETKIPKAHSPLLVYPDPKWLEKTHAIPYFTGNGNDQDDLYENYIKNIIEGQNSFFIKRETVDEYGWRNFGDIYADHEAVHHKGPHIFVAHYNNQYDFVYGGIIHFLRTGKAEWFELARDLARHVMDIDIYHTEADKAAFNHGQFWHTDHYKEAKTCTHRGYSRLNKEGNNQYGGGPSNENDYASGLLLYYYLTGDPAARGTVIELAEWVIGMDDGGRTIFSVFDDGPTGLASQTADTEFHKPGRGAGNSINTLLDAFRLTHAFGYLEKAEALIRRTIHPVDDINSLQLDEPEYRWSYLVYLQVLGKYLDLKVEFNSQDSMFFYARDSLLHYARWMFDNETPYKEVLHKVDLPTETWPAQDIRKNHVFHLAAKYAAPDETARYRKKAEFFYQRCLSDLLEFETAYLARPMVLLAVYGYIHSYFHRNHSESVPYNEHAIDFGAPVDFVPQRSRFKRTFIKNLRQSMKAFQHVLKAKLPISVKK